MMRRAALPACLMLIAALAFGPLLSQARDVPPSKSVKKVQQGRKPASRPQTEAERQKLVSDFAASIKGAKMKKLEDAAEEAAKKEPPIPNFDEMTLVP